MNIPPNIATNRVHVWQRLSDRAYIYTPSCLVERNNSPNPFLLMFPRLYWLIWHPPAPEITAKYEDLYSSTPFNPSAVIRVTRRSFKKSEISTNALSVLFYLTFWAHYCVIRFLCATRERFGWDLGSCNRVTTVLDPTLISQLIQWP